MARRISAGKSGGYYKPFTTWDVQDPDVAFVENSLLNAPTATTITPPVRLPDNAGPSHAGSLAEQVGDFSAPPDVADTLIVEGPDLVSPSGSLGHCQEKLPTGWRPRSCSWWVLATNSQQPTQLIRSSNSARRLLGVVVNGVTSFRPGRPLRVSLPNYRQPGANAWPAA